MGYFHKGMSAIKQRKLIQKNNQVQDKTCWQSKVESSFKPLQGKIFYLDLRDYRSIQTLEEDLEALGGIVEKFLSKDVSYVITNRRDQLEDLQRTGTSCSTPSPFSTEKKNMGGSVDSPLTAVDPLGSNTNDKMIMTRGQAIIQKVSLTAEKRGTSDVLDNARRWGVQVRHLDSVVKWIDKQRKKNLIKKEKPDEKTKVCSNSRGRRLRPPFIKFEAANRHYRVVYKEFNSWPHIDTTTRAGVCPFNEKDEIVKRTTKSKDRVKEAKLKDRRVNAKLKSSRSPQDKKKVLKSRRSGYCEICCVKYDDLDMHIQGEQHQTFVSNQKNYAQLDNVITQGPDIHRLLKDYNSNKLPPTINSPQSCEEIKFISELSPRQIKKKGYSMSSHTRRALALNSSPSTIKVSGQEKKMKLIQNESSADEICDLRRGSRLRTHTTHNESGNDNCDFKINASESNMEIKNTSPSSLLSCSKLRGKKCSKFSQNENILGSKCIDNKCDVDSGTFDNHLQNTKFKKRFSSQHLKDNLSIISSSPQVKGNFTKKKNLKRLSLSKHSSPVDQQSPFNTFVRRSSRNIISSSSVVYDIIDQLRKDPSSYDKQPYEQIEVSHEIIKLSEKSKNTPVCHQVGEIKSLSPLEVVPRALRSSRSPVFPLEAAATIDQNSIFLLPCYRTLRSRESPKNENSPSNMQQENFSDSYSNSSIKKSECLSLDSSFKPAYRLSTNKRFCKRGTKVVEKFNSNNTPKLERRQTRFQSSNLDGITNIENNIESKDKILLKNVIEPLSEIVKCGIELSSEVVELGSRTPQRAFKKRGLRKKLTLDGFVPKRTFSENNCVNRLSELQTPIRVKNLSESVDNLHSTATSTKNSLFQLNRMHKSLKKTSVSRTKLHSQVRSNFKAEENNANCTITCPIKKQKNSTNCSPQRSPYQGPIEHNSTKLRNQRVLRSRPPSLIIPGNLCEELLKENIQVHMPEKLKKNSFIKNKNSFIKNKNSFIKSKNSFKNKNSFIINKKLYKKKGFRKLKSKVYKKRYIISPKSSPRKKINEKPKQTRKVKKVRLKTPINLLTDRSMLKLLYGDSDEEYFEGFYEDTKELPTDLSFMQVSQLEVEGDSDVEWIFSEIDQETSEFEPPTEADLDFMKFGSWLTTSENSEWDGLMESFITRQTQGGMNRKNDSCHPELRVDTEVDSGKENKVNDAGLGCIANVNKIDGLNTASKHSKETDTPVNLSLRNSGSEDGSVRVNSESVLLEKDTNVRITSSNPSNDISSPVKTIESGAVVKSDKVQINEIKSEIVPVTSTPLNSSLISDEVLAKNCKIRHSSAPDAICSLDLNSSFDAASIVSKKEKVSLETLDESEDNSCELESVKSTVNNILTVLNSSELDRHKIESEITPAKVKKRRIFRSTSLSGRSSTSLAPKVSKLSRKTSIDRLISTCKIQRRHSSASLSANEGTSPNSSRFSDRILKGRGWSKKSLSPTSLKRTCRSVSNKTPPKLEEPFSNYIALEQKVSLLEENYEFKEDEIGLDTVPGRYISAAR